MTSPTVTGHAVLRESGLPLGGEASGLQRRSAPGQLVELAQMFTIRFGPLHRFDSQVLDRVRTVFDAVDEFCRGSSLLTLPREPVMVRFADWVREELVRQDGGGEPTPWPGPSDLP